MLEKQVGIHQFVLLSFMKTVSAHHGQAHMSLQASYAVGRGVTAGTLNP